MQNKRTCSSHSTRYRVILYLCVIIPALWGTGCTITLHRATFSGMLGTETLEVDIRGMEMIEQNTSRVYYPPDARYIAPKVLAVLSACSFSLIGEGWDEGDCFKCS